MSGPDFLQLDVATVPRGQRTAWLTHAVRQAIEDGRLAAGTRLPATRVLGEELEVSRGTVIEAYEGGLIIEDDYDAEYRYDRTPIRALHTLAPDSIAYTASLSKTLAPALRLGWLVVPAPLHDEVVTKRWATDLGSPALPQLALASLIRTGMLEKHLRAMRARHRKRRDAAVCAVARHLPGCTVLGIAAGVQILVMLPEHVDDTDMARRAAERGIEIQPLSHHRIRHGTPGLVIGYGAHTPERIERTVRTLGEILPG